MKKFSFRGWLIPLAGIAVAAIYSHIQLNDTKQVMAVGSMSVVQQGYSVPKARFFERVLPRFLGTPDPEEDTQQETTRLLLKLYTLEYLLAIEHVCTLYVENLLGKEARRFIESQIRPDLEEFLLYLYDEEAGAIQTGAGADDAVSWLQPDGTELGPDSLARFPSTAGCLKQMNIALEAKNLF